MKVPTRRLLSQNLQKLISKDADDFVASVPASELNLDLLSLGGGGSSSSNPNTKNSSKAAAPPQYMTRRI
eukprot:13011841-Ditylum_brightwellii.AAC.1